MNARGKRSERGEGGEKGSGREENRKVRNRENIKIKHKQIIFRKICLGKDLTAEIYKSSRQLAAGYPQPAESILLIFPLSLLHWLNLA